MALPRFVFDELAAIALAAMTLDIHADLFDDDFTAVADDLSETMRKSP